MEHPAEHRKDEYEALLEHTGLSVMECVCLGKSLSEQRRLLKLPPQLSLVRDATLYAEALRGRLQAGATVTFREAVRRHVLLKQERRTRTRNECRSILQRMMRTAPGLEGAKVRGIGADRCRAVIEQAYRTPSTRAKARRILHNLFETARLNGWCDSNPVAGLRFSAAKEKTIPALTLRQLGRLLRTLRRPEHAACIPAVALMLWAGIRPEEVARLRWADVDLAERAVYVSPQHSKTGGARQVPLRTPLPQIMRAAGKGMPREKLLAPPNWGFRWKALRRAAGFAQWRADTLRHTFASYHFKRFSDPSLLQWEMGHSSQRLLRTRYLNMRGITAAAARKFWSAAIWKQAAE